MKRLGSMLALLILCLAAEASRAGAQEAADGNGPSASKEGGGSFFGQGGYEDVNLLGLGWRLGLFGHYESRSNYGAEALIEDPRVADSRWSLGTSASYRRNDYVPVENAQATETAWGGSVRVGHPILDVARAVLTYRLQKLSDAGIIATLPPRYRGDGLTSSLILQLIRSTTGDRLNPQRGYALTLAQQVTGGVLGGDYDYAQSSTDVSYVIPWVTGESYRSYFRLSASLATLYTLSGQPVPYFARYRLGGYGTLRGYEYAAVGPRIDILTAPTGTPLRYEEGGTKRAVAQLEYYFPLIAQANLRGTVFAEAGAAFDHSNAVPSSGIGRDIGMGLRWLTPLAPLAFDWAYPVVQGHLGEPRAVFSVSY